MEEGETFEETLQRELLEEAGLEVGVMDQIGLVHLRHTTPKPKNYPFIYPDFLWPVFVASVLADKPDAKVDDGYEIRAQVRQVYNCRTPNRGRTVYAAVSLISTGHLPPWERARRPSKTMRWDTSASRSYYNTYERIDARDEVRAAMKESTILIPDQTGELNLYRISELVDMIVFDKAAQGVHELDPDQLARELEQRQIPVSPAQVVRLLAAAGFPKTPAGTFLIRTSQPIQDLTK